MTSRESNRSGLSVPTLALTAVQVAQVLGVSRATVWRMHASGRLPSPVRFGRVVRWRQDELEAWLRAGAPARREWEGERIGTRQDQD
jgi:excisionase family DNA binding protein